ncbi:MAG: AAA family ATPase [Nanoarchaeota archaeon]
MDEKIFSEIVNVSSAVAENSKVSVLRKQSKIIVEEILSLKSGVFIIAGLRGTGKTTILSELKTNEKDSLFINAEVLFRHSVNIFDFCQYAISKGYKTFLIDEIHALTNWEKDIKILYDETKGKFILSGSSAITLKAKGSELSRRARIFQLRPFSFREYISFRTKIEFPQITMGDILNHQKRKEIEKKIQPYLHYYSSYCQFDALPAAYFEKNKEVYINILERTVRYDLLSLREVDSAYIENALRAVKLIASSSPGELSYSGLSSSLGVGIKLVKQLISTLHQTGIITLIPPAGSGKKAIRKEEKILMPLSFRAALCNHHNLKIPEGSVREDFFIQHVGKCTYIKSGRERRTPDFLFENVVFEVGGPSKGHSQIKEMNTAYVVKEIASSYGEELSLYLFGFLY